MVGAGVGAGAGDEPEKQKQTPTILRLYIKSPFISNIDTEFWATTFQGKTRLILEDGLRSMILRNKRIIFSSYSSMHACEYDFQDEVYIGDIS